MNSTKTIQHIVKWLKDYAVNAGVKGFVIGISGGIDSALTSALAAKTGLPLLVVEMPIHQDSSHVKRARNHINWLTEKYSNVSSEEVKLTSTFDALVSDFPKVENEEERWLALANTRARLRMTTLYYFAGLNNQLVLGTGNKVEDFGIGFFTKYGDGGVDLSPIGDLLKSDVYKFSEELNINKEILEAAPSDGLWGDERSDEEQIGATYPELEWAMNYNSSKNENLSEREKIVLNIYSRLNRINQHKMTDIPVCKIER